MFCVKDRERKHVIGCFGGGASSKIEKGSESASLCLKKEKKVTVRWSNKS